MLNLLILSLKKAHKNQRPISHLRGKFYDLKTTFIRKYFVFYMILYWISFTFEMLWRILDVFAV